MGYDHSNFMGYDAFRAGSVKRRRKEKICAQV
jgi:hypothetical protein